MSLRDDILNPISGERPSGENLRFQPIYDRVREARRQDDSLAQGAWQRERKTADHALAVQLIQQTIATESKDLQLAAWLCDSLLKKDGIGGLREGLDLCEGLLQRYWDTLFPQIQDGEFDDRLAPLEWLAAKLLIPVKFVPLCHGGYSFLEYSESRTLEYEELARSKDQKTLREKALKEGKLAPELFDKSFAETPKAFYADLEKQFDGALEAVRRLDQTCVERFGDQSAPSFTRLSETLQEVRRLVHQFLQKKREIDPDPPEPAPPAPELEVETAPQPSNVSVGSATPADTPFDVVAAYAPETVAGQHDANAAIVAAAALLRGQNPLSPAPYLLLRGLRWGELRGSKDPAALEAPPSELRRQIKRLALDQLWPELLELAENVMALPCSRAWLDLQRFVVEACAALGEDYDGIAVAIRSGLRALLRDLPHLLDATLNDDTPAANHETREWLQELLAEPVAAPVEKPWLDSGGSDIPGWRRPAGAPGDARGPRSRCHPDDAARTGTAVERPGALPPEATVGSTVPRGRQGRGRTTAAGRYRGCH
jgi:type VI secretion system protein ImpA